MENPSEWRKKSEKELREANPKLQFVTFGGNHRRVALQQLAAATKGKLNPFANAECVVYFVGPVARITPEVRIYTL